MSTPPPNPNDFLNSDLIKIGIPSLVTLVTGLYSFILTLMGHKKDIFIEKLRSDYDKSKIESEKKSALVMEIVVKISAVENAMAKHSGVFRSESIHDESMVTDKIMKKIRSAYLDVGTAIDACIGARAQVDLLGDSILSAKFNAFLGSLFTFQNKARPDENMDALEMTEWFERVGRQKEAVLEKLSEIHFGTTRPASE